MKLVRIKSSSVHEALAEAKKQLGENVTVLHTKQYDIPGPMGIGKKQCVEILAGVDSVKPAFQPAGVATAVATAPVESSDELSRVVKEISDIKNILVRFDPEKHTADDRKPIAAIEKLERNGVPEKLAEMIAPELVGISDSDKIIDILARRIRCSGGINCKNGQARVALIGPTGVGKTTTAAKLAAHQLLVEGKRVALLTLDTYRVGAVEQLATYARILNVPIEVAMCPEEVDAMVRKHCDKDVIIIDTVGRSQRNSAHLAELSQFVKAANPTEVCLVVSASASSAVQKESVNSFRPLAADRLILTKLDECPQLGCILDLAAASVMPYAYITYGQEVPDDLSAADSRKLAGLVWEGSL